MTPNARIAAAAEVLDSHLSGQPIERALTNWARSNRFAGSKDRAAIRDWVFEALRKKRTSGAFSMGITGRLWMAGLLLQSEQPLDEVFTGQAYAPSILTDAEHLWLTENRQHADSFDAQDWVLSRLEKQRASDCFKILKNLQNRAPITIRANLNRTSRHALIARLAEEDIGAIDNPLCATALTITQNPRRLTQSKAFEEGLFEMQDAASQAAIALLGKVGTTLDYCAGGGGKSLAMAGLHPTSGPFYIHDVDPKRMQDAQQRANRAGVRLTQVSDTHDDKYDVVLCDVPCSGSGAWRRSVESKWSLSEQNLATYQDKQREIVQRAIQFMGPKARLCYITCSIFEEENQRQRDWIIAQNEDFVLLDEFQHLPDAFGDGLYSAVFERR